MARFNLSQQREKFGYTPYIIKDDGKYNETFVKEEFNKFINYLKDKDLIN